MKFRFKLNSINKAIILNPRNITILGNKRMNI